MKKYIFSKRRTWLYSWGLNLAGSFYLLKPGADASSYLIKESQIQEKPMPILDTPPVFRSLPIHQILENEYVESKVVKDRHATINICHKENKTKKSNRNQISIDWIVWTSRSIRVIFIIKKRCNLLKTRVISCFWYFWRFDKLSY